MRYLSVCSGIEAASVAWGPLGWSPVAVSEIDPFACALLAHHYHDVPNWGDLTKYETWPDATIDLLVGGTPCQSFSVAGGRAGLDDPRGQLMWSYLGVARRYRPTWLVWENVPGVLSSGRGRDFGAFLGALVDLGYGFAYRVLDAQYFGLAQRRKRVFIVGRAGGDWRRAAAVLLDAASLRGDPPPRRETRQVAPALPARRTGGGGLGTDAECDGAVIPVLAPTLPARGGGGDVFGTDALCGGAAIPAGTHTTSHANGGVMPAVMTSCAVRRLTPEEAEVLQGFPRAYTKIPYRGKPAADGPRYKALGNSMAVPVMAWIGRRIAAVDRIP